MVQLDLPKHMEYKEGIIKHLRFECVTSLRECQIIKPKCQLFVVKNGIVLLYKEKQPRQKWLLGKFVDLIPSQDGRAREARV